MSRFLRLAATVALGAGSVAALAAGATAAAAATQSTTTTFPLFGAPVTVDVTVDGNGALTTVAINPAATFVADAPRPNAVVFENTAETAHVVVKAADGRQRTGVVVSSLKDITGKGSWAGDVFGDGAKSSVDYTVGSTDPAGLTNPTVTIDNVTSTLTNAPIPSASTEDHHGRVSGGVLFTKADGSTRTLVIGVFVDHEDDHGSARLRIELSKIRPALVTTNVVGDHTWSGLLCDGKTAISVTYSVAADGTISKVTPSDSTAKVNEGDNSARVRFADPAGPIGVNIQVSNDNGTLGLRETPFNRCKATTAPTVNVPTETTVPDEQNGDGDSDGKTHPENHGEEVSEAAHAGKLPIAIGAPIADGLGNDHGGSGKGGHGKP
jgi:hypothetical protein